MNSNSLTHKLEFSFFTLFLVAISVYGWEHLSPYMDSYERAMLPLAAIVVSAIGWAWRGWRYAISAALLMAGCAILQYPNLAAAQSRFLLKYLLASQQSILWMSTFFGLALIFYWVDLLKNQHTESAETTGFAAQTASRFTWIATTFGLSAMFVRWYESYLVTPGAGHIPVSNLYEVFVLFVIITSLLYLHYEKRYQTRQLGGFVLLIINAAIGFLLWYSIARGRHEIQPLLPALQSWWMKIHVPANFIGYGAFAISAMTSAAWLVKSSGLKIAQRLPDLETIDEFTYRAVAIGFLFFTIATVLGALWAADAWGAYWQWDPKEVWALVVWLNYAAWLHLRLMSGWRGAPLAWWALVGLLLTTFAFVGVNMWLSGLHSYGQL